MEIRDKIIKETLNKFLTYGIRNVTMDGIAANIGISKRTVYEIFKDKTELIHTCLKQLKQDHEEKNHEIISSSRNVIETIFAFMREGIKGMSSINPVFFMDMKKFYSSTWNSLTEENEKNVLSMTVKLLEEGIEEGLFRSDIKITIVAKLFYEQMNLLADEKVFPRDLFNYADVFQSLIINFVRGISTQKGIEIIESNIKDETSQILSFTQEKDNK
ncbi:MAG: TetR/AcrR family transcriptional regulator [Bacteroidales bacterium]|nr:TetR/AcrR family transcriptional regulator [Bacteroidales bacterium]